MAAAGSRKLPGPVEPPGILGPNTKSDVIASDWGPGGFILLCT